MTPQGTPEARAKMQASWTPQRRAAQADRMRRRWQDPKDRAAMTPSRVGHPQTPETRRSISKAVTAYWTTERRRATSQESIKHWRHATPEVTGSAEANANDAPPGGA